MAELFVKSGVDAGSVFLLNADLTTVGRNSENNIALNDGPTSRFHAKILRRGAQYYIQDLGSTHGTFINNVRATHEMLLSDQDSVRIGTTELLFRHRDDIPRALPTAPPHPAPSMYRPSLAPPPPPPPPLPSPWDTSDNESLVRDIPRDEALTGVGGAAIESATITFSLPSDIDRSDRALSGQHLDILSRVAKATESVFDLNELLRTLMDTLFEVFHPDRGVILLIEEHDGKLAPRVQRPADEKLEISQTIINHAVEQRMSLLVADMAGDDRFNAAHSIMAQSILAAICCPLVCKDRVLGVIYIDTQSHLLIYQKEELALLNIIAANAAISIENAMLVQEKLAAERLAAIGVAVAGISHYIKNILSGITGSSQLIEMGMDVDNLDVIKQAWPILQRSNKKISNLVNDMLTYSKKREPDWQDGHINDLLTEVYENQKARADELGVDLRLEIDPLTPPTRFDPKGLHDTLLNIAGNAIDACAGMADTRVTLCSGPREEGKGVQIWIADNGPGIPEEIRERILEPFFSTKGSKGTGLGLAVARKTVEEHNGRLILESEVGKGATFKILLPMRASQSE